MLILASLIGLAVALAMGPAQADLIVGAIGTYDNYTVPVPFPSQNMVDFSQYTYTGKYPYYPPIEGPQQVGPAGRSIIFTSNTSYSYLGGIHYSLEALPNGNGFWEGTATGGIRFAGVNDSTYYYSTSFVPTITFTFENPVAVIGAFMNYDRSLGDHLIITALGISGNSLESWDLTTFANIVTPSLQNAGAFRGIAHSVADIFGFRVENGGGVLTDLRYSDSPVPIPGAVWLLGSGLLGLVGLRRRFKK